MIKQIRKKEIITSEQMTSILDVCYNKAINGIPGSKNACSLGDEYIKKYENKTLAVNNLINNQIAKCSMSGFLSSLGGIITLPVAIPANIASVLYVQIRMIAAIAHIGGYDVNSDEVQTLVYLCLAGSSITDICKSTGINIANKTATNLLKKVPGAVLTKINQKVGFRLITKFGETGAINLVKLVPVAGGLVGGGVDFVSTRVIAEKAKKMFIYDIID